MKIQWKRRLLWQPQGSIDLQSENVFHHHYSFSFDRMCLKLADKVDMDEILRKFEKWPDWIINLRVTSPCLLKKASVWLCHQCNPFSSWNLQIRWIWMISWTKSKTGQIGIINLRVMSPWLLKKPLFDFVISISHSVLIRSSWTL